MTEWLNLKPALTWRLGQLDTQIRMSPACLGWGHFWQLLLEISAVNSILVQRRIAPLKFLLLIDLDTVLLPLHWDDRDLFWLALPVPFHSQSLSKHGIILEHTLTCRNDSGCFKPQCWTDLIFYFKSLTMWEFSIYIQNNWIDFLGQMKLCIYKGFSCFFLHRFYCIL